MKQYIYLTYDVHWTGGVQCVLSAEIPYLISKKWNVKVYWGGGKNNNDIPYENLKPFANNHKSFLLYPPSYFPYVVVNKIIKKWSEEFEYTGEEIIIVSHDGCLSQWGEILAEKLHAKHFFALMNEQYSSEIYQKKIDFYKYKFYRKELLGTKETLSRLFVNVPSVEINDYKYFKICEAPVQDINADYLNVFEKCDYNICYIGRAIKPYVPNVIEGVISFAESHTDKTINFVLIGDFDSESNSLINKLRLVNNIVVTNLGVLIPIPRKVFSLVDVVIAGSGSARASSDEGVPTIVADSSSLKSAGLLGYDNISSLQTDPGRVPVPFDVSLEETLIDKSYLSKSYVRSKGMCASDTVDYNMAIMRESVDEINYYDSKALVSGRIRLFKIIKLAVSSVLNR